MTLLAARSLDIRIGGAEICRALNFEVRRGEYWALLGGNGAGKTTLLHGFAGLRPAGAGSITVDGTEIGAWRRKALARVVGLLFQDSQDTFPGSVLDTALCGCHPRLAFWEMEGRTERDRARHALEAVELGALSARQVNSLSGGERRRLAIATLLVQDPLLWLLDEPTNHLDLRHQVTLMDLLVARVRDRGGAMVAALHDVNLALRFCTHAVLMVEPGTILQGPVAEVVTRENLERLYRHPVQQVTAARGAPFFYPD